MNPRLIVQSLHDVRAKILFAFLFAGHAMDLKELMNWTGSPRQGHYSHLNTLCAAGVLGIQKKAHGEHVYVLGSEMLPVLQAWIAQLGEGKYLEQPADQLSSGQMSAKQTPGQPLLIEGVARTAEELNALKAALADHRIIEPTRTELIGYEWVSGEYVRAVVEFEKWEPKPEFAVHRAINAMRSHVSQPARRGNGHIENCQCGKCKVDIVFGGAARGKYLICPYCNQYPCLCEDDEVQEGTE
jgi:hypothetical protein